MPDTTTNKSSSERQQDNLFERGGEMGALIRAYNWSKHPMGEPGSWPQSLTTGLRIMLESAYPMFIWWSSELYMFHNDPYLPALGKKHPEALGAKAREMWSEIWEQIGQVVEDILAEGKKFYAEDLLMFLERKGFPEETYWTFSYSPMPNDDGSVGGVFCACSEVSGKVIGERRLKTLKDIGDIRAQLYGEKDVCQVICDLLTANVHDIPYGLIYLLNDQKDKAYLNGRTLGVPKERAPGLVPIDEESGAGRLFSTILQSQSQLLVSSAEVERIIDDNVADLWSERTSDAIHTVVIPIVKPGKGETHGFFILGVSPKLEYDADYQNFHNLLAGQVATTLASVEVLEEERRRSEALAEIDKAKTVFFSNISHEFRTPLTLMLGPLEDILKNKPDPMLREQLLRVQRNGQRMLKLVNTLLEFSRMEAGRVQARFQPLDLAQLTTELSSVFRSAIEKEGLQLEVDCPPLPQPVYVDARMWERIIFNLLSNALKFTFKGKISVRLFQEEDKVVLQVADSGTGIPAEELPHLFSRFHRIEGARSRTHEGSGIGLAMVSELAGLHAGSVEVESTEGAGTTFSIYLPVGKSHLPEEQIVENNSQAGSPLPHSYSPEEYLNWLDQQEINQFSATAQPGADVYENKYAEEPTARLLLVDDNADMRAYLSQILAEEYEVMSASNGQEAWKIIQKELPDLVISDVMMPVMNGIELVQKVRSQEVSRTIPVILLSARAGEDAQVEGIEAGADDYLTKPFSVNALKARVRTNLKLTRLYQALNKQEQEARSEAERQQARLLELFSQAPVAIGVLKGKEHIVEVANPAICQYWGRTAEELLDKPLFNVLTEVKSQVFSELLDQVFDSGEPYVGSEMPAQLMHEGKLLESYFNFVYHPWKDEEGKVTGIIVVATDVSEQVRVRKELEDKHEELLKINSDLDNFIYMASHDLKAPITNIESLMTALNKLLSPEKINFQRTGKIMEMVEKSIHRFKATITDLSEVARIQREDHNKPAEEVNLKEILEEVLLDLAPFIQKDDVTLDIDIANCKSLRFSAKNLRSVVYNLLSNAIKYRSPDRKPHIDISCQSSGEQLQLSISDNGLGLSPEDQKELFTMFKRFHSHVDGTGVGLSIVKKIVENAGGTIEVESELGKGTSFHIFFKA
ncbi:ATP-binding protein [Porifericola rhodea]|uniref:ATP-binding protein n=1 Tax=Porifericola rhodea TaxID=930972 RepID=UPI0026669040|nr:ATP-binding protein [Porifericola rhodea]WKN33300.1 ATP-binding protein [Porifericola rhodea]